MTNNIKPLNIKFQERFSLNFISNIIYFIINIIIGLAIVPFYLDTLGSAAYALIPLATSLTSYITVFTDAVNGSISRYLTIDLQRSDITQANKTYNTSLFGILIIVCLCIPIALIISSYSPILFDIGNSAAIDVVLLFALIFISVLIRAFGSTFMTTMFAYNRMDLRNIINIIYQLAPALLIVSVFFIIGPSLSFVGFSYLLSALLSVLVSYYFSKKICPALCINRSDFSMSRFLELGSVTIWLIINRFGALLVTNVSLIFVNILYGSIAETGYSLVLTFNTLIIVIGSLITSNLTPMNYFYYSENNIPGLIRFSKFSIKIVGLIMALPISIVCVFAPQILTIWVGNEYIYLVPLMWLLLIPSIFEVMVGSIGGINIALLRVKFPAVYAVFGGILNILLIIGIYILFDIGIYSVALAYIISRVLFGVLTYTPMYCAYILKAPLNTFIKPMAPGSIALLILSLSGIFMTSIIEVNSFWSLIIIGLFISATYFLTITKLYLKESEKDAIRSCIPKCIQKFIPRWIL